MTEAEYDHLQDCDTLSVLLSSKVSDRKWRLFVCHVIRDEIAAFSDSRYVSLCRSALEAAEVSVENVGLVSARRSLLASVYQACQSLPIAGAIEEQRILVVTSFACDDDPYTSKIARALPNWGFGRQIIPALLRDIFGNPFRLVVFDPRWRTTDVVAVAQAIYDDKAFDRLPLLADALMDAGCDDQQVIGHCRGPGPHVRGCWVVDLVLGKS